MIFDDVIIKLGVQGEGKIIFNLQHKKRSVTSAIGWLLFSS